jgi:hypothetical protein
MRYFIFLVLVTVPCLASAEPSKTFRYLMDEPVTMFEWGIYKLNIYTNSIKFKNIDLINSNSSIGYDWDKNRLKIEFVVYPKYAGLNKVSAIEICKLATTQVRKAFGTEFKNDLRSVFGVSKFFEHEGFVNKSRPDKLMEEVEHSTKIIINVYANKSDEPPFSQLLSCESPLMGKDVLIIENTEN